MKKILLALALLMTFSIMSARKTYCIVRLETYMVRQGSTMQTDNGESLETITDSTGMFKIVGSRIEAINEMAKRGWEYVPDPTLNPKEMLFVKEIKE